MTRWFVCSAKTQPFYFLFYSSGWGGGAASFCCLTQLYCLNTHIVCASWASLDGWWASLITCDTLISPRYMKSMIAEMSRNEVSLSITIWLGSVKFMKSCSKYELQADKTICNGITLGNQEKYYKTMTRPALAVWE